MQTPPPFNRPPEGQYYQQPMKPKKNPLVIVFAILGVLTLCCGLPLGFVGYFGYKGFKGSMGMISCYANTSVMAKALKEYSADHEGKLPPAATWQTDLAKYFKSGAKKEEMPFKIWQPGGEWSCGSDNAKTGFMFNEAFGGKLAAEVAKSHPEEPAIFETKTVAFNQTGAFKKLPFEESPRLLDSFDEVKERRGWIMIMSDAALKTFGKSGKLKGISSGSGSDFNFDIDTEEGASSGATSSDSADGSNSQ
ncbi:MAG: hypothetical protein CBB60_006630 [Armatimonadetes bacterium Cent15-Ar3]|nr:MAG: hypothetical protein CBB60_006630 [Armatimonadetes bacterium Cent15-Ar3]